MAVELSTVLAVGERLRRCASRAAAGNPLSRDPWTAPAAWQASTAYIRGQVVSNSNNWYVCCTAGTSASSGGPTTVDSGNAITDGTAAWTWLGGAEVTADDAKAPVLTTTTSNPAGLTNFNYPGTYPGEFRAYGCTPAVVSTFNWALNVLTSKAATVDTGKGASVAFVTDDLKFAVAVGSGSANVRFIIDGRYYSVSGTPNNAATTWYVFDFTGKGVRKPRTVIVESPQGSFTFLGVAVSTFGQVWAPDTTDDVRAVFIGDSLYEGSSYGPWLPGGTFPDRVGKLLGWSDCWNLSKGGTGYIATGASSYYTYAERVPQALALNPDVWVFGTPINDRAQSAATVQAAALAAFQAVRAGGSTAPIIVSGCWPINDAAVPTVENAVAAAVTQFADSKTFFIPIYGDAVLPWVTNNSNHGSNTSSTNTAVMIAGDGVHPADVGTTYFAHRFARAVRTSVLPALT
jgi:hypothetical protein